ncbi:MULTISPECIES: hypothetical protein [unclassified Methylobacterium]|nr:MULTISPECIES: hypothetical protein [unclassified Methylobacterium]
MALEATSDGARKHRLVAVAMTRATIVTRSLFTRDLKETWWS